MSVSIGIHGLNPDKYPTTIAVLEEIAIKDIVARTYFTRRDELLSRGVPRKRAVALAAREAEQCAERLRDA